MFFKFKGRQIFRRLVENCLGYTAGLSVQITCETPNTSSLSKNKFAFKQYLESFPEERKAIAQKAREKAATLTWIEALLTTFTGPLGVALLDIIYIWSISRMSAALYFTPRQVHWPKLALNSRHIVVQGVNYKHLNFIPDKCIFELKKYKTTSLENLFSFIYYFIICYSLLLETGPWSGCHQPSYNISLLRSVNQLSATVLVEPLFPSFRVPRKYTEKLFRLEYLCAQPGKALQRVPDDDDRKAEDEEDDQDF